MQKAKNPKTHSYGLNAATVTGIMGMFGLFGFVFLAIKLLENNLDPSFVFALLALFMAAVFGICFLLFRQSSNQTFKSRKKEKTDEETAPNQLSAETVAKLQASYQSPISSVTENTTRTLDEILIERK